MIINFPNPTETFDSSNKGTDLPLVRKGDFADRSYVLEDLEIEPALRRYKVKGRGRIHLDCRWEGYHDTGVLESKGTFLNGYRVGCWQYYDEKGRSRGRTIFNELGERVVQDIYREHTPKARVGQESIDTELKLRLRIICRSQSELAQWFDLRGIVCTEYETFYPNTLQEVRVKNFDLLPNPYMWEEDRKLYIEESMDLF